MENTTENVQSQRLDLLTMSQRMDVLKRAANATGSPLCNIEGFANKRFRTLTMEFYPDSTPDDVLTDWVLSAREHENVVAIYGATHAYDTKSDGTPKKPHTHVDVYLKDAKTWSAMKKFIADTACPLSCIAYGVSDNIRRSVRYLVHRDSKQKYQYGLDAICSWSDDVSEYLPLSPIRTVQRSELQVFIADLQEQCFTSLLSVMDFYAGSHMESWACRSYGLISRLVTEQQQLRTSQCLNNDEYDTLNFYRQLDVNERDAIKQAIRMRLASPVVGVAPSIVDGFYKAPDSSESVIHFVAQPIE